MLFSTLLMMSIAAQANGVKEQAFYGKDFKATESIPVQKVLADFDQYKDKEIVVKAKAEKVCAKKGCWMSVKLNDKTVRVKFKDYAFFVPLSLKDKQLLVKGTISRQVLSIADTKHYLEDEGAPAEVIAAVTKPSHEYHFLASGVKLAK